MIARVVKVNKQSAHFSKNLRWWEKGSQFIKLGGVVMFYLNRSQTHCEDY